MTTSPRPAAAPPVRLPEAPALAVGLTAAVWLEPTGEVATIDAREAVARIGRGSRPFVCHAKAVARRLNTTPFPALDVLELYAFVRPGRFCIPSLRGLAKALLLTPPETLEGEAEALFAVARALLAELRASPGDHAGNLAWVMARGGWPWGAPVMGAVGAREPQSADEPTAGLRVWTRLKDWEETAPRAQPEAWPVEPVEARARLVQVLGADAEHRPQQMQYASEVVAAFAPRDRAGEPHVVLAEAGTGVGKTLGYIAPASVWTRKNRGAVWISTYTRNLQRQIDQELDRLYTDLGRKSRRVVVRKGRENMFCLLNMDEAVASLPTRGSGAAVALGLVARWASATRDGDMIGGDFPGWLADLLGPTLTVDLTDTRGECIYGACRHYRKCFVERAIRRARRAEIVVANHALVMVQAALGGPEDASLATRYVFDEGHHLFEAADSAFSAHLTGRDTADLRRWLIGAEERRWSRSRGLRERLADLLSAQLADDDAAASAVEDARQAARTLPGPGWRRRLAEGAPIGATESLLSLVRHQVLARSAESRGTDPGYALECDLRPPVGGLVEAAGRLEGQLARLAEPLTVLVRSLATLLDAKAETLDTAARQRVEAAMRSIERRALGQVAAWRSMLRAVDGETPPEFVDWLGIDRAFGTLMDAGLHRHWRDPMRPFIATMSEVAHGMLITSATLRDNAAFNGGAGDAATDWAAAEARTGARHLGRPAARSEVPSPFDYATSTRIVVVTDVNRDDEAQVAAAYRELFLAAGGGALGVFTAIGRLRATWRQIAQPLDQAGLKLLAQHVDALDTGTLIDIFRAEPDTCLLGTDAVRDGIDVPGQALRLIVFDRVPWPRPDILHRARREVFGGRAYDEMLTRLKLKQAYGRLIRRADDRGVFVMLDRALPSRLCGAFPEGVPVQRAGLADTIGLIRCFFGGVRTGEA
ncbi:MAG: ATP-dependent DNA helicase [Rhodospirillales bacterium]|nr:ATP-dependent DNA helicase [Rhodospirillales bacterium]